MCDGDESAAVEKSHILDRLAVGEAHDRIRRLHIPYLDRMVVRSREDHRTGAPIDCMIHPCAAYKVAVAFKLA